MVTYCNGLVVDPEQD